MKVDVLNMEGQKVQQVELSVAIFEAPINVDLMHQAYIRQMANARLGTHDTKVRGEVAGGGRKPWKQKGTGRARQGGTRAAYDAVTVVVGDGGVLKAHDRTGAADAVVRRARAAEAHLHGFTPRLPYRAGHELRRRSRRHRAGRAHFALAPHLRARDGGIVLDQVADEPGGGQRPQDRDFLFGDRLLQIA